MTTLLSADEKKSLTIKAVGYRLSERDMLIVGAADRLAVAAEFLATHGVSGVYFDSIYETYSYKFFKHEAVINSKPHAIRLFNQ